MKKIKLHLIVFFAIFIFVSCNKNRNYVYSMDKKQCITVITENNIRYIIEGKHTTIPKNNYVKYSLESIDLECGDQLVGCWKNKDYDWNIINDNAVILENKLDTLRFKFSSKHSKDRKSEDINCFGIDFINKEIKHHKGIILQ